MIHIKNYRVLLYRDKSGVVPYLRWIKSLNNTVQARIDARISRFKEGQFGDVKLLVGGIYEARFFIGSGYRVYFIVRDSDLIVVLGGGNKATQARDIYRVRRFLRDYLGEQDANKK